ncbi:hypothetical protein DL96DRAFT_1821433 [Flagelloscypha sp. PMI_526]|nr:hypothetical protein DL96DRAFT_1821433 [Flagelloscypha sp. PMI_526]
MILNMKLSTAIFLAVYVITVISSPVGARDDTNDANDWEKRKENSNDWEKRKGNTIGWEKRATDSTTWDNRREALQPHDGRAISLSMRGHIAADNVGIGAPVY